MSGQILNFADKNDPIADFATRVYKDPSPKLRNTLRYYQALIKRWNGEMILVTYEHLERFSCGILSSTCLIFGVEDVFFPTGGWHMLGKNSEGETLPLLENMDILVPNALHDTTYNPNVGRVILGSYLVEEWFVEHSLHDLFDRCTRDLKRAPSLGRSRKVRQKRQEGLN